MFRLTNHKFRVRIPLFIDEPKHIRTSVKDADRYLDHSNLSTCTTFAVRETASLGIMGEPRVPPLNPSESIVL